MHIATCLAIQAAIAGGGPWGDQVPPEDVPVHVPGSYDPASPAPLLILLHGYTVDGNQMEKWLKLWPASEAHGFLYAYPTGSIDIRGKPYWNATDFCCDFGGANPDHIGYLVALIKAISDKYSVDPNRVYLVGYSNGGFMCHRMACERPDLLASIIAIAGLTWYDPDMCPAAEPVHVLQVHGTKDKTVLFEGGLGAWGESKGSRYPGAVETVEQWASHNGCQVKSTHVPGAIDIDAQVPGPETQRVRYDQGCDEGGSSMLWQLEGSSHVIFLTEDGREAMIQYLLDHPKPAKHGDGDVTEGNTAAAPVDSP